MKSCRGLRAKTAVAAAGASLLASGARAQSKLGKRPPYPDAKLSLYSRAVACGNKLFLSVAGGDGTTLH